VTSDIRTAIASFYAGTCTHSLSVSDVRQKLFPAVSKDEFRRQLEHYGVRCEFSEFWSELVGEHPAATWWDALVLFVSSRAFVVDGVAPVFECEDA
jgi:hypothetical protein